MFWRALHDSARIKGMPWYAAPFLALAHPPPILELARVAVPYSRASRVAL